MEAGGSEEETLQTAFKKLRVDAESVLGAVSVSEAPRAAARVCVDSIKPKLSCSKENWHGCMRKTSRGASRTQRRRRSKSPILHPPKFTYCSSASASLSAPSGCLKQQRLAVPEPVEPRAAVDGRAASSVAVAAQTELCAAGHRAPLVFGSRAGYETPVGAAASREIPAAAAAAGPDGASSESSEESGPEKSACDGAESGAPPVSGPADAADFRVLSELHSSGSAEGPHVPCSCAWRTGAESRDESGRGAEPRCRCRSDPRGWAGVEVYSFTGLRDVISECERSLPGLEDAPRTLSANGNAAAASSPAAALSSGSPRSCSEEARAYVDDITIEDLSGYMEFYLYIPKKMSHMAEMMYT